MRVQAHLCGRLRLFTFGVKKSAAVSQKFENISFNSDNEEERLTAIQYEWRGHV